MVNATKAQLTQIDIYAKPYQTESWKLANGTKQQRTLPPTEKE
jgi:hypothetical protein